MSVMGLNGPSSGVTRSLPEQILLQVCRIRAPCDSASEITGHSGQINPLNIVRPSAARRCFLAVRQRPVGSQRNSRRRRDLLSFTPRQRGDFRLNPTHFAAPGRRKAPQGQVRRAGVAKHALCILVRRTARCVGVRAFCGAE